MSGTNITIDFTVVAGGDLSALQFRPVTPAGILAVENDTAIGILQNKPAATGRGAQVSVLGVMKAYAGAAIAAGARVKVTTSGWLITTTSGDGTCVGKWGATAANSGDIGTMFANFINANTLFDQQ